MKRYISIIMGGLAILLLSLPTFAAAAAPSDVFELGEIIITGTLEKAPPVTTTNVITAADIEKIGADSVGAALNYTGGVWTTIGTKDELNVRLRGFEQQKVLVLLDGIPVSTPYYGYLDLNQIPIDNVAKITITKGIASPLYGSDAMGGVVDIVTKKPSGKASGSFKVGMGKNDTYKTSISYYTPLGNKSLSISAGLAKSDGFEISGDFVPTNATYEDGGLRTNSDYDKKDFSLKFGFEKKNPIFINFNYVDSVKGMPVNAISPSGFTAYSRWPEWTSWTLDLSAEQNLSDNLKLREKLYYHKFDNTMEMYTSTTFTTLKTNSFPANKENAISIYDDYSMGLRLLTDWTVSENDQLNFALNVLDDNHKSQAYTNYPWEEYETRTYSLGVENTYKLSERLGLITGVSYDKLEPKTGISQSDSGATTLAGITAININRESNAATNPMIGISITPDAANYFHITYGKKTRFPTQRELYSLDSGNATLLPQRSYNTEAGFEHKYESCYVFSATYFHNSIAGLIGRETIASKYKNYAHNLYKGFEFSLQKNTGRLTGSILTTFLSARDQDAHTPMTYRPAKKYDANLSYRFCDCLSLDVFGSHVSARWRSTTASLPDYNLFNIGLSGDIKNIDTKWRVFVDNINDIDYSEEYGFPQAGRTIRGEFDYSF